MGDDVLQLCASGLFPKLPFLLEEREESDLKDFFQNPTEYSIPVSVKAKDAKAHQNQVLKVRPISVAERQKILEKLLQRAKDEDSLKWWLELPAKSRVKIILFLSESSDELQLWSNHECGNLVVKICNEISKRLDCNDNSQCPLEKEGGMKLWFRRNYDDCLTSKETDFHHIIQHVKVNFNKSDWKYFPPSVHGFHWTIQQIHDPLLTDHIDMIIPPALLFSDDHFDDFKLVGLKLLALIVSNSDKKHLVTNNWANVIYDAVHRHMPNNDPVVTELMMSILIKVLDIVEDNPSVNSSQFTKYDKLLKDALYQMEFNSDLNRKRIFLPMLKTFMDILGLATLHWCDKICDVLRDYAVCNDSNIWSKVLDVTATLIKNTWPNPDSEIICEIVLRGIFNVSSFHAVCLSEKDKSEIVEKASHCLLLLQKCNGLDASVRSQLSEITQRGNSENLHPEFIECLKQILAHMNID